MAVDLIEFILATAGLTYIVTRSRLFHSFREWWYPGKVDAESSHPEGFFYGLFTCPMCVGFWTGGFMWILLGGELNELIFVYACIGSIGSYAIYQVIRVLKGI